MSGILLPVDPVIYAYDRKGTPPMKLVLRTIQKVAPDKWEEKVGIEKRFQAAEARVGNAAVRHYRCMAGADSFWTYTMTWRKRFGKQGCGND